ncbi:MAG TPA: hypothetical protein VF079_11090 [Sphingomicrobium sp.]
MSGGWRDLALTVGILLALCGAGVLMAGAGPALLIAGGVVLVTAFLERTYGAPSRRPAGRNWRPTDERFVDPETGKLVTVWYDPATGERRYVADDGRGGP